MHGIHQLLNHVKMYLILSSIKIKMWFFEDYLLGLQVFRHFIPRNNGLYMLETMSSSNSAKSSLPFQQA